jgi:hypothetical protein
MSKAKITTFGISTRFSSQEGFIGSANPPSRTLTFSKNQRFTRVYGTFFCLPIAKQYFYTFTQK